MHLERRIKGEHRAGRTGSDGDEEHKYGAFRIAIANGGRDGGEPLIRVTVPLILHDFAVVQRGADDEGAQESNCDTVNLAIYTC